jgi:acetoin utilization protein AcuB
MHVSEWMTQPVISIKPEDSLQEAEARMRQYRLQHLPVLCQGTLVGLLSDRDLQSALPSPATTLSIGEIRFYLARIQVAHVMTRRAIAVAPQTPLAEAARLMRARKLEALPVVEAEQVVGILTTTDLLEFLGVLLQHEENHEQYALR